jgi:hypothetical protein
VAVTALPHSNPWLAASPQRALKVFRQAGYDPSLWEYHGPSGFTFRITAPEVDAVFGAEGSVIVTQADWHNEEWLHASMAFEARVPTYDELVILHEAVFGPKRTAYQVFAAADRHVNIHAHALHLWGRADGTLELPDFGEWGTI